MNTTAAIFFLIIGQGSDGVVAPGGLALIHSHYQSLDACATAGEAARNNDVGLYKISYTCVPAEINSEAVRFEVMPVKHDVASASKDECPGICELVVLQ